MDENTIKFVGKLGIFISVVREPPPLPVNVDWMHYSLLLSLVSATFIPTLTGGDGGRILMFVYVAVHFKGLRLKVSQQLCSMVKFVPFSVKYHL